MLQRPTRVVPSNLHVHCKGTDIEIATSTKYLGVIIDEHLSCCEQVENVCRKVGTFRHGCRNLTVGARRLCYLSIVQSTLDYASSAYVHCLSTSLYNQLLGCGSTSMKKVFSLSLSTLTDSVLKKVKLYSLQQRVNLKLYVLVYRCLNLPVSPLLKALFVTRASGNCTARVTCGQDCLSLQLPKSRSRFSLHAVSFLAADRWNMLPNSCRLADSLAEFVHHIKLHLGYPVKRQ